MNKKEQQKAKNQLKRNFFMEAFGREMAQEHSRQLSKKIKAGVRAKKERENKGINK